jgi:hypothetical protein
METIISAIVSVPMEVADYNIYSLKFANFDFL